MRARSAQAALYRRQRSLPWASIVLHALLIACVAVIAFPLYFAFVILTQDITEVVQRPPRLLPSTHLVENYAAAWRKSRMGHLLLNSAIMGVTIAVGKFVKPSPPPSPPPSPTPSPSPQPSPSPSPQPSPTKSKHHGH